MSACCGDKVIIRGGYEPLSQRLLSYGKEAYSDVTAKQRVVMWIFIFYDNDSACQTCKSAFDDMFAWFHKYGLFTDPSRAVRTVVEDDPEKNLIYTDFGMSKLPMLVFTDSEGRILDILFEFPNEKWLNNYIMPYIQADGKIG